MKLSSTKKNAFFALILFVPAPSIGVLLTLHLNQGLLGSILWGLAKFWLLLGPLFWLLKIEKIPLRTPFVYRKGILVSILIGILMMAIIWSTYYFFAKQTIDTDNFTQKLAIVGLNNSFNYLILCFYWIFINSLLEEFVFRFFLYHQAELLWPKYIAVLSAALFFTLHHTLALAAYLPLWQNLLASFGVFSASIIWSTLYAHYRSIWPGYISHMFADIAIFYIGWDILFR